MDITPIRAEIVKRAAYYEYLFDERDGVMIVWATAKRRPEDLVLRVLYDARTVRLDTPGGAGHSFTTFDEQNVNAIKLLCRGSIQAHNQGHKGPGHVLYT